MLGFGFEELYALSPEVALSICKLRGKAVTHRRRRGDWIRYRCLRDVGLYPDDSARSVRGGRNSGITVCGLIGNGLVERNGGHSVSTGGCAPSWPYMMLGLSRVSLPFMEAGASEPAGHGPEVPWRQLGEMAQRMGATRPGSCIPMLSAKPHQL